MAKHRGQPEREVSMIAGRAVLTLNPEDLPLIERLLADYARRIYWGGREARGLYGYSMRHNEARALADKVRKVRRDG